MSYSLKIKDISSLLETNLKNETINFPNDIGFMSTNKYTISDELLFFKTETLCNQKISIESHQKVNALFIGMLLYGNFEYKDNFLNKTENFKKYDIKISYINEFDTITKIASKSFGIGLYISNTFLEKNFSKFLEIHSKDFENLPSVTFKNQISKNIRLANDLYNSPFDGELDNIYLQSKVLELIYNEFSEILNLQQKDNNNKKVKLSQEDIEALYKAKTLIVLENDFSDLITLAKKVAINEFKLKYGFKQLFNITVGQMILEQKMLYAKQLLETSEFSIAEISSFVGYKYQQNFTTAFTQFFSIRPKDVMKTRNYYF